jgi:hypothetical protein
MSQKTSFWQNHTFVLALIAVAIALAFVGYIAPTIQAITIEASMPTWEVNLVTIAKEITNVFPPTIVVGFGWSLFGYLREKSEDATVNYELTRLSQTMLWFISIATPFAYGLNNVALGTTIATGFMAAKAVINQFKTASQPPTFHIKITAPATGTQSVPGTSWEETSAPQTRIDYLKSQGYIVAVLP